MKLGCRYSNSGCRMSSRLFKILIFLLKLSSGSLQLAAIKCDWSVQRWSLCPPYPTTDWHCLQAQLSCTTGEEYHCVRDESGEWTEICAKAITCSKGQEPVLKNSQIVCTNCRDPERYEPVEGTASYKYSECRRKKTTCPQDVSHECPVDEVVRHSQNRLCRCDHKKNYMPQNYDLTTDTWKCKESDDLNCIHAPCPEDVYGNEQTRGSDYRCYVPPYKSSTPSQSKGPSDRPSTVAITEKHTTWISYIGDTETDAATSPKLLIVLTSVLVVALVSLLIAIFLCKVMKGHLWCRRNKLAMPEGPIEVPETEIQYRQMSLAWQPPNVRHPETHKEPLVIHYLIDKLQGNTQDWISVTSTKETSCQVTGLEPGTFYNFRVGAQYKMGISSPLTTQKMYQTKCLTVPEVPQGPLSICEITTTYITLSWEPPVEDGGTPVTGYMVRYCNRAGNDWIIGQVVEKDITVWKLENLVKGMEYRFQVTAKNEVGESQPLETENPVKFLTEPGKPDDIDVIDIKCNKVTLCWIAPKDNGGLDIQYYHIRQKQEGGSWEDNILKFRSGVLSQNVVKLKSECSYYFGVCAENAKGKGEFCDTEEPTKLPKRLGAPDSPLGPLKCVSVDYNELILSWNPPLYDGGYPLTHYEVEGKKASSWVYSLWINVSPNDTKYLVKNLKDGTAYCFRVFAVNEKGPSQALQSDEVTTKTIYPPGKPEGPLTAVDITDDALTLVWNKPLNDGGSPILQYHIEKKENLVWSQVYNNNPEETRYRLLKLSKGKKYQFRVRAVNQKGAGDALETETETRTSKELPGPPVHLVVSMMGNNAVRLRWRPPENATTTGCTGFIMKKKEGENGDWVDVKVLKSDELTYTIRDLPFKDMYFSVSAVNALGTGAAVESESPVTIKYSPETPSTPVGPLRATYIGATEITLAWQPPEFSGTSPIQQYFLHFACGKRAWKFLQTTPVEDTVCHIKGLQEQTNYRFRVTAENQWGRSDALEMVEKVKTKTLQAPLPPTGPIESTEFDECSVRLTWKPPKVEASALTGYMIEYRDIQETFSTWKAAGIVSAEKTTWVQHNLVQGHEYKFRVFSNNSKGNSEPLESQQLIRPIISKGRNEAVRAGTSVYKADVAYDLDDLI